MNKNIIALIGAVALLSACETASQKVVTGTGSTASSSSGSASASTSSSVDKSKSLFAQAKQTASDVYKRQALINNSYSTSVF